jgi:hypothetical protein
MKNMWVKKVIAAAVTLTMLTTSASTLSVMADAESTTETEATVDSVASVDSVATVSDAAQEVQPVDAQTNEAATEPADTEQKSEESVAEQETEQTEAQNDDAQVQAQTAGVVADEPKAVSEESKGADITAPVCESISIDKQGQTIDYNDEFTVSIKAYDADSGIDHVEFYLSSKRSDDENNGREQYCYINDWQMKDGYYTKTFKPSDLKMSGDIWISSGKIVDNNGNLTELIVSNKENYPQYTNGVEDALYSLKVTKPVSEDAKITIKSVECDQKGKTLKPGDKVVTKVYTDGYNGTGVSYGMFHRQHEEGDSFSSENKYSGFWLDTAEPMYNEYNECIGSKITWRVPQKVMSGTWKLGSYGVSNDYYAYTSVDESLLLEFKIQGNVSEKDLDKAHIGKVTLDKCGQNVTNGQSVKISVEASDSRGIDGVNVTFTNANSRNISYQKSSKEINLTRNEATGLYEGTFDVDSSTYPGEWYVSSLNVYDADGWYVYAPSLEDSTYFNAYINGTFVNPTYNVSIMEWDPKELDYVTTKSITVPRRTNISEIKKAPVNAEVDGLKFDKWENRYLDADTASVLRDTSLYAKYDKNIIVFTAYAESGDNEEDYYYDSETLAVIYAKAGEKIELPKVGYSNYKWEDDLQDYDGYGSIDGNFYTVGDGNVQYVQVEIIGEKLHGSENKTDTKPSTPSTPSDQNTTKKEPVKLDSKKIETVVSEISASKSGQKIDVDMGKATVVPKDILEAAKGKDVDVVLKMNGYSWTINGKDILSSNLKDIDLAVTTNTNNIPGNVISSIAGNNPVQQLSLAYSGDFGFKADLTLNVGANYAGKYGNLYYYDSTGRMVFMNAGAIGADGNVTLGFSHASEYAIVISDTQGVNADNKTVTTTPAKASTAKTAKSAKTDDTNPVLPLMVVLFAGVALVSTVFIKRQRL